MIDTDAAPGDYAPYFERAPTYGEENEGKFWVNGRYWTRCELHTMYCSGGPSPTDAARTLALAGHAQKRASDRAKLIARTNEIRAKHGLPAWEPVL